MALNYASPSTQTEPQSGWRTNLAGLWLLALLYAAYVCFQNFAGDQDRLAEITATAFGGLAMPYDSGLTRVLQSATGPLLYAFCIGSLAAAVLWHLPRSRLKFIALLPTAAGLWRISTIPSWNGMSALMVLLAAAVQIACVYAGTKCGRRIAQFLAELMLPPALAAMLIPLWTFDPTDPSLKN